MFCAENVPGLSIIPKIGVRPSGRAVEEHSICSEVVPVRDGGADGSENVGISSKKFCENQNHRKSKVSWATVIDPGLGGPNRNTT